MDPQVPASFIPKKPLTGGAQSGGAFGLMTALAVFIFLASLAAGGAAFGYGKYLETAIADKAASLELAEKAFKLEAIQELVRIDTRLKQAEILLAKHVAPSGIFTFLSSTTLERVQFTSMAFDLLPDGSAKINLAGTADSFSTLALQSDKFGGAKALKDVIFSGITTDSSGRVVFVVNATADPSLILYSKNLSGAQLTQPAATTP